MLGVAVIGLGVGRQHALTYVREVSCKLQWVYDLEAPNKLIKIASIDA